VTRGGTVLREVELDAPRWLYSASMRAEDGPGSAVLAVAQLSNRFGPGPFRTLELAS
jgi:hypothetical protein